MPRRRIDPVSGRAAVVEWAADPEGAARPVIAIAVRYSLEELSLQVPGRSVEVRVPPYGAVQVIEGPRHTRGTPPNVVEMTAPVWLNLVVGRTDWDHVLSSGDVRASGQRADLARYLPLVSIDGDR